MFKDLPDDGLSPNLEVSVKEVMQRQSGPDSALRWPEDYPPESGWKRFFIGVRWFGPDVTFFRHLGDQQAARTAHLLEQWGSDPGRRGAAEILGRAFQSHLQWSTSYFSPHDEFRAVAAGPHFGLIDHGDLQWAVEEAEQNLGGPAPEGFWARAQGMTLGEVVDSYLRLSEGR